MSHMPYYNDCLPKTSTAALEQDQLPVNANGESKSFTTHGLKRPHGGGGNLVISKKSELVKVTENENIQKKPPRRNDKSIRERTVEGEIKKTQEFINILSCLKIGVDSLSKEFEDQSRIESLINHIDIQPTTGVQLQAETVLFPNYGGLLNEHVPDVHVQSTSISQYMHASIPIVSSSSLNSSFNSDQPQVEAYMLPNYDYLHDLQLPDWRL